MLVVAKVGHAAPEFAVGCVDLRDAQRRSVRLGDYAGRWLAMMFYPRDFSFVCPTELTAFSGRGADFRQRGCALLGVSVDSLELHREWLERPPAEGGLGPLQFPLASDPDGAMARAYGVWVDEKPSLLARLQNQELGRKLTPHVEEPYQELLAAMLRRDPARRPAMREVLDRLSVARGPAASDA